MAVSISDNRRPLGDRFVRDLSGPRPVAVAHQEFQLARGWLEVLVVVELPGRGEVA